MSHYSTIRTRLVNREFLVRALADLGFSGKVQVHDQPVQLHGYRGDRRRQRAEVVIPRKYVGRASNDIGFRRNKDDTFDAIISDYDKRKYSKQWLGRLAQRYAYHSAVHTLREQGFAVVDESEESNGQLCITLRRTA
jgi:hypothetical protein